MTPDQLLVAIALAVVVFASLRARGRARDHLRRIESRVDVLFRQLGLDESPARALSAEVRMLAERGEMIRAIRLHREENPGLGLREARDQVDAFGGPTFGPRPRPDANRIIFKLDRILESFDIEADRPPAEPEVPEDVVELARDGRKIEAIKRLREHRPGIGLAKAREIVEGL